jgi:hypothetical protein
MPLGVWNPVRTAWCTSAPATGIGAGFAAAKLALVGLALCGALAGGIALVRAEQSQTSSTPPPAPVVITTPSDDFTLPPPVIPDPAPSPTVDPACANLDTISNDLQSVKEAESNLDSAVSAWNSSVNAGNQGDWGPVQTAGGTVTDRLQALQSAIDGARSQASDPTLASAYGDMSSATGTWSQQVQAFVDRSTNSYDLSPDAYNSAVLRANQACPL